MHRTVFSHPDFLAAIAGCQPSAPALDRICWPSDDLEALAGSCLTAPTAGGESHPALKTSFVVCRRTGRRSL